MATITIETDSACASAGDVTALISDGKLLKAVAVLNRRWDDYSAISLAKETGLQSVEIDVVGDETVGALILTVYHPFL